MASVESLGPLGQIALNVTDLAAAIEFYRDRLGLKLLMEFPGLAFFDLAGIRLMLSAQGEGIIGGSAHYFKVADLPACHTELAARGVDFQTGPQRVARLPDHDLWMAFFRDPSGNQLALMSEVRPPAPE